MKVKYDHVDMTGPSRQGLSVVSTIDYLMGAILEVCMVFSVTIISSLTRYTTSSGELFFGYVWWCSCLQSYHYVYFQLFFGYVWWYFWLQLYHYICFVSRSFKIDSTNEWGGIQERDINTDQNSFWYWKTCTQFLGLGHFQLLVNKNIHIKTAIKLISHSTPIIYLSH